MPDEKPFEQLWGDAETVVLLSPSQSKYDSFAELYDDTETNLIVVGKENHVEAQQFVELPLDFPTTDKTVQFSIEGAMKQDLVEDGSAVLCGTKLFDDQVDTITRVRASEDLFTGLYDLFMDSRADPEVIRAVIDVAIDLGKKGQKGKPVGALFVVGDAGTVMNKSRPLSYNPFEKSHVHVDDPIVNVMLKEFSRLDGAFIISDSGKIASAYRYLEPGADGVEIPKGLGARHMAGAGITQTTNATSIVLSESDGLVRAFKNGELLIQIDPEEH